MSEMSYNKELKPGIQALVIGYRNFPQHLGRTVTLGKFVRKGDEYEGYKAKRDLWEILGDGLVRGIFSKEGVLLVAVRSKVSFSQPHHLMPLYPEADPLSLGIKEKENVQ